MSAVSSPGTGAPGGAIGPASEHSLPPITQIAIATLTLIVAGGIYLAASLPAHVTLAPAIVLLAAAAVMLLANLMLLSRISPFAWERFLLVARWTLLAYLVVTGMLAYVFIYDGVRGGTLGVLLGMLAVFALDVPLMIAFTVARYADPEG
jgi:hypothetical protein